jgi:predicted amidohydrolase YtcJ
MPDHRLSLDQTLEAYTRTSAWVEYMEDRKGMLKPGYLADLVILSGDLDARPHAEIVDVYPVTTICDGRITYQAG